MEIDLSKSDSHADADADLVRLAAHVAEDSGLEKHSPKHLGLEGLALGTANCGNAPLGYYVELDVRVVVEAEVGFHSPCQSATEKRH